MSYVQLENVTKNFAQTNVINDVDLRIDKGEFVVFVGPSGCGKSTLLRLIAGLEAMSSGHLFIGGQEMTGIDPSNRGIAMVFQSYALFPHMTVEENITFGMRMNRFDKAEIAGRLERAAAMLHLTPLLKRKPAQLSGGQRQRVAIGRAIVRNPNVFLFDEPLSNLDAALRHDMRTELLKLHRDLGATMIYVTHDQVEAMTMADKIVVLNGGRIEQVGSPLDLYLRPANLFVAEFLGSPKINTLKTSVSAVTDGHVVVALLGGGSIAIESGGAGLSAGCEIILAVRPEHLRLGEAGDASMEATVELIEHLGSDTILNLRVDANQTLTVKLEGVRRVKYGERVAVGLPAQACMIFDTAGKILVESRLA